MKPMTAMLIGGALGIGGGLLSSKKKSPTPSWSIAPEYVESEGARKLWWEKLQSWGNDPSYGAISPDWAEIWNQAKQKVMDYYNGTPTTMGARAKLRGAFASRNLAPNNPGMMRSLARLGAEEGANYRDLATDQAIQKAEFGEKGRQDWLSSLQELQSRKPVTQFYWQEPKTTNSQRWGAALSTMGSGLMAYGGAQAQLNAANANTRMLQDSLLMSGNNGWGYASPAGVSGGFSNIYPNTKLPSSSYFDRPLQVRGRL